MRIVFILIFLFNVAYGQQQMFHSNNAGVTYDVDAQAYFTALEASVSPTTAQKNAINTLIVNLKANGVWAKSPAIYFPVWNNTAADKWNMKDPRDLDAAYRLTFHGTITHSTGGLTGDGSTGYADTKLTPSNVGTQNSSAMSFYSRTNTSASNYREMGVINNYNTFISILDPSSNTVYGINGNSESANAIVSDSRGLFTVSRTGASAVAFYKNGSSISTSTLASTGRDAINIYILGVNAGSLNNPTVRQCALAAIHEGLNSTEAADFYTEVQALMTAFGINV